MRKILLVTAALCLAIAGLAQAQDYWNPPTLANRNASGFEYYMLEVPDPGSMKMDGYADDWAWFDPEYILTFDEWKDEGDRVLPSRADLDVTTYMGWKGAPLNRWYVYMAAHDDTLCHGGTDVARWTGDMIGMILDPQDHGRTRSQLGYSQEYVAAPGNVQANFMERYPESEAQVTPAAWREYGVPPYLVGVVRVEPAAAWAADVWTSATGGDTYYEYYLTAWEQFQDGGPAASVPRDLNAQAGEGGFGLPFVFFYEDGDGDPPAFNNDMTTRGSEATARQYFSHAVLLKMAEYAAQTAVEPSTWGRIKNAF